MNSNKQRAIAKRVGLIFVGLSVVSPLAIDSVGPLSSATAEAQTRNRARDYRNEDLQRLALVTVQGRVTSNVQNDYFELRGDDNNNYRVMAREGVSLRSINRNDQVEVYGRRDGNIIIAQSVRPAGRGGTTSNQQTLRGVVQDNLSGNRFVLRDNNRNVTVTARNGKPDGLRAGRQVEIRGRFTNNNTFEADRVILIGDRDVWQDGRDTTLLAIVQDNLPGNRFIIRDNNRNVTVTARNGVPDGLRAGREVEIRGRFTSNNAFIADRVVLIGDGGSWQDGRDTVLRGTVVNDQGNRRFGLRINNNQTVNVTTRDDTGSRVRNGDTVEVRGRWNSNERQFRADSVRILNSSSNTNPNQGARVEFRGVITDVREVQRTFLYTVRSDDRRSYLVRSDQRFSRNDRVRVRGNLQGNMVNSAEISRW